jgi:ATP-dependent RNA helicase DDX5/DBP2
VSVLQRAGMKGTSYTYFTTENAKSARELIAILRDAKAVVPPQLEEMSMFGGSGGGRSKSMRFFFLLENEILPVTPLGRYSGGGGGGGGGSGGRGRGNGGHRSGTHDNGYGNRGGGRW